MPNLTDTAVMLDYHLIGPFKPFTNAQKKTLATRYTWIWWHWAVDAQVDADLLDDPIYHIFMGLTKDLKSINPQLKVGVYLGGICNVDFPRPHFPWIRSSDMLHQLVTGADVYKYLSGSYHQRFLNPSSALTRKRFARRLASWARDNLIDGIYFDAYDCAFQSSYLNSFYSISGPTLEGDTHDPEWWIDPLKDFATEVTARMNELDKIVGIVGLGETGRSAGPIETEWGLWNSNAVSHVNEIISEYCARMHSNETYFVNILTAIDLVLAQPNARFFFNFLPKICDLADLVVTTDNQAMQRKGLALYLLIKSANTIFGYWGRNLYDGTDVDGVSAYVYDSVDWDLVIGEPTGARQINTAGTAHVYWREYVLPSGKNVYVVVNKSRSQTGQFGVNGSYKDWHPTTGTAITVSGGNYTVAAGAAHLLFEQ